jgi:hypothetical protein
VDVDLRVAGTTGTDVSLSSSDGYPLVADLECLTVGKTAESTEVRGTSLIIPRELSIVITTVAQVVILIPDAIREAGSDDIFGRDVTTY